MRRSIVSHLSTASFTQRIGCLFIALLLIHASVLSALADEMVSDSFLGDDGQFEIQETQEAPELLPSTFGAIMRLVGALLIVLLIMGGLLVFLRRWSPPSNTGNRPVSLLSEEPIGQKRSICLVKVGEQILVVGVTSSNISYLTRIDDPDLLESLQQAPTSNTAIRKGWNTVRERLSALR